MNKEQLLIGRQVIWGIFGRECLTRDQKQVEKVVLKGIRVMASWLKA